MKFALLPPILLGSVFCVNSWAGDVPARPWDRRFALYGGGINYSMDGTFSSSKDDRPDIDVDMDDLGLDEDKLTYFLGAALRVGERWRLRFDYFRYHDKETETVDQEFEFDGEV